MQPHETLFPTLHQWLVKHAPHLSNTSLHGDKTLGVMLTFSLLMAFKGYRRIERATGKSGFIQTSWGQEAIWPYKWIMILWAMLSTCVALLNFTDLNPTFLQPLLQQLNHVHFKSLLRALEVGLGSAMFAILNICTATRGNSPHYGEMATLYALLTINNIVMATHETWWPSKWMPYKQEGLYLGILAFSHFTVLTLDTLMRRQNKLPHAGLLKYHLGFVLFIIGTFLMVKFGQGHWSYLHLWYGCLLFSMTGIVDFMDELASNRVIVEKKTE